VVGVLFVLAACSSGSGTDPAPPPAVPSSAIPSALPTIAAPKSIPDPPTNKTSVCDDARFWAAFINDAEHALYDQGQVNDELHALLPKLQQDVLAGGGASTQSALGKLVPAGTAVLADKVGGSSWLLDLATFGGDLKAMLKYLPNCQ
jgi:hypothetical protein